MIEILDNYALTVLTHVVVGVIGFVIGTRSPKHKG